jgi:beta-mannosidase
MAPRNVRIPSWIVILLLLALFLTFFFLWRTRYSRMLPEQFPISSGWQLQDAALVPKSGADLSLPSFDPSGWHPAIVPGTVLTSLVNDGTYPEPLYGENNRPDKIPETLCRTDWWYRTRFQVPAAYTGRKVWLNFDGINYAAEVWLNGRRLGMVRGAFIRGLFDVTAFVSPGREATLAVRVSPQPHPGTSHEHTLRNGVGKNGGITAIDGPTFLCAIGWDWIPAIRDRDTGIWRGVFLSASGPVTIQDPAVTTDLPVPRLDVAEVSVTATLANQSDRDQQGILTGEIALVDGTPSITFRRSVTIPRYGTRTVSFDPLDTPALLVKKPALWWPNGYGPQNLYRLSLSFGSADGHDSDHRILTFGIRKITYSVPGSKNLTLSVNGVPVFCRGGDWGMDEALKRIPFERLDAQVRMHRIANLNMIRNWVGQSTSEDLYDLCDRYGILLWDEFFQPNPGDGPNPTDIPTYLANVRDKILRFRNHPSIALWCGRNEGPPPPQLNAALQKLTTELDPTRHYQASSTNGGGVHSGGPYFWRPPVDFYNVNEPFKTETGSVSIPTLESIQGMMPRTDWEVINDDWAEHDLCRGAQRGDLYPGLLRARYGDLANLADFARKGQLANYEAFRAMYEGRNARLFQPFTGVITWMSHPAQPSFVWQLYHHDLEANSALFAVRKACEPLHIQMNENDGSIAVINNLPTALSGATARVRLFNLDGTLAADHSIPVTAPPSLATNLGPIAWPATLSPVHFVKLELMASDGGLISDNFYWHTAPSPRQSFRDLDTMPPVGLEISATAPGTAILPNGTPADGAAAGSSTASSRFLMDVTVHNPTAHVALMAHLQLRRASSGERVLPAFYSDNYLCLVPGETKNLTIEAGRADLQGESPLIAVDGWNVTVANPPGNSQIPIALNANAQVDHWPRTGLPTAP